MSKLECKLFGVPQILQDGQPVFFSYAKISALLYYILIHKTVSREEAAGLLWPDETTEAAKRNLRNAIYQARKALGEDIILSPRKSVLLLNQELDITVDVDQFMDEPQQNIHLYDGELLQGFFLKDSEAYEFWLTKMRSYYKEKFTSECQQKIEEELRSRRYDRVEGYIRKLIAQDEYDERSFRLLMRFYQETGLNGKAIETYFELAKRLRQDLGVDPDQSTKRIYERSLVSLRVEDRHATSDKDIFFHGRYEKLAILERAFKDLVAGDTNCRSILITGEPGAGKSTFKRRLLEYANEDILQLEWKGVPSEHTDSLGACRQLVQQIQRQLRQNNLIPPALWRDIMTRVFPDFQENLPRADFLLNRKGVSISNFSHIMVEAIEMLSAQQKVILVIDDLQWFDGDSLKVLTKLLRELSPKRVGLLATCGVHKNRVLEDMTAFLRHENRLLTVELERLSMEACHQVIKTELPKRDIKGELLERIYSETEGVPFYLSKYVEMLRTKGEINALSPEIQDFIRVQLFGLSAEELELASTVSYYYDAVPLKELPKMMGKERDELLAPLETLEDRGILTESPVGEIAFVHPKIREYLYQEQSEIRRKLVHSRIAARLERDLKQDGNEYKLLLHLAYHYTAAGEPLKAIGYRLASLRHHLDFGHEFFPIDTKETSGPDVQHYISRDKIDKLFRNLGDDLQRIRSRETLRERTLLEIEFFYLRGRYYIWEGDYENGVQDIMAVVNLSKQMEKTDYTFQGYRQLIYYYYQIGEVERMREYIDQALDLAVRCNNHREIGILLRLNGLHQMLQGRFIQAERMLHESISTLTITERAAKDYTVNVAAAYDYLGEIRLAQGEFSAARELFQKALSLCPQHALSSLSVFYINAGKAAYFLGDRDGAKEMFTKAYAQFGQFDSFWLRPTLDAYTALTLLEEGDLTKASEYLDYARENMWKMKYPGDLGTVFFAETIIRSRMAQDAKIRQTFSKMLPESVDRYYQLAIKYLNPYLAGVEREYLKKQCAEKWMNFV